MKRVFGVIGLMGGILVLVGIFTPWITASFWRITVGSSAWDCITEPASETYCYLAFAGGIVAIVGTLCALAIPRVKLPWGILATGGILAIAGSAWAFIDISSDIEAYSDILSYGYGLYLTLIGGILSLAGVLGLFSRTTHGRDIEQNTREAAERTKRGE